MSRGDFLSEILGGLTGGLQGYALDQQNKAAQAAKDAEAERLRKQDDFERDYRMRMAGYVPSNQSGGGSSSAPMPTSLPPAAAQSNPFAIRPWTIGNYTVPRASDPPRDPLSASFMGALGQSFGGTPARSTSATAIGAPSAISSNDQTQSNAPTVNVPLSNGDQSYTYDYDRSPQGLIEKRQQSAQAAKEQATAAARATVQRAKFNSLKLRYPDDPLVQGDFDSDTDYAEALKQRDDLARDAARPHPQAPTRIQGTNGYTEIGADGAPKFVPYPSGFQPRPTSGGASSPQLHAIQILHSKNLQDLNLAQQSLKSLQSLGAKSGYENMKPGDPLYMRAMHYQTLVGIAQRRIADAQQRVTDSGNQLQQSIAGVLGGIQDGQPDAQPAPQPGPPANFGIDPNDPDFKAFLRDRGKVP